MYLLRRDARLESCVPREGAARSRSVVLRRIKYFGDIVDACVLCNCDGIVVVGCSKVEDDEV